MNVTEAKRRMLGEARKAARLYANLVGTITRIACDDGMTLDIQWKASNFAHLCGLEYYADDNRTRRLPARRLYTDLLSGHGDFGEKGRAHRRRAMAREEDRRDSQRIRTERRIHGGRIRQQPDTPLHGKHSLVHRPRKKRRGRPLLSAIPTQGERGQGKNARNPDPPCSLDQIPEHGTVPPIDPRLTTSNLQQQNRPGARG